MSTLLRRFFPFYCALAALATFGYALYDGYQIDGDAVAYMDIGDLLRAHHWAGIVNGYWHPMYPAFLALGHMTLPGNSGYRAAGVLLRQLWDISAGDGGRRLLHGFDCAVEEQEQSPQRAKTARRGPRQGTGNSVRASRRVSELAICWIGRCCDTWGLRCW